MSGFFGTIGDLFSDPPSDETEKRYLVALENLKSYLATLWNPSWWDYVPLVGAADYYGYQQSIAPIIADRDRIVAAWGQAQAAHNLVARSATADAAEMLVKRVKGDPNLGVDGNRTNTLGGAVADEAKADAAAVADGAKSAVAGLAVGSGAVLLLGLVVLVLALRRK